MFIMLCTSSAEWWKADTETVISDALESGANPAVSDAHTFNGNPGVHSNCSRGGFHLKVESGNTYMLRVINAALNDELFFKIAERTMTVIEVDANYVKPFKTDTILVAPGQTTNVIIKADKSRGKYMLTASTYHDSMMKMGVDKTTGAAILQYVGTLSNASTTKTCTPSIHATSVAKKFRNSLRSLNSKKFPARVPLTVDHSLLFTVGLGMNPCPDCMSMNMNGSMNMGGSRFVANVNNITFVMLTIAILQAHVFNIKGVFTTDFPGNPPIAWDYTGPFPSNMQTDTGTKVYRLPYNSTVQLVLQDTGVMASESHPMHLHGCNFFAVGWGLGNYNPKADPKNFNLVDPVERNTVEVPSGGWVAIRFRDATQACVWFMHTSWGLQMAFLVENGIGPSESILPPPSDLPNC